MKFWLHQQSTNINGLKSCPRCSYKYIKHLGTGEKGKSSFFGKKLSKKLSLARRRASPKTVVFGGKVKHLAASASISTMEPILGTKLGPSNY